MSETDLAIGLKKQLENASWDMLEPHYERNAIYIIDQDLDFIDVAVAITEDHAGQVKQWLADGMIYTPLKEEVEAWKKTKDPLFKFLIIQPYVLIQKGLI